MIEIRGDRCFGVVGLLGALACVVEVWIFEVIALLLRFRGARLCGESMDILGDQFLMRLGAIACVVKVWIFWAIALLLVK